MIRDMDKESPRQLLLPWCWAFVVIGVLAVAGWGLTVGLIWFTVALIRAMLRAMGLPV